ncbi:MAG: DUF3450 family protein [bacterium]
MTANIRKMFCFILIIFSLLNAEDSLTFDDLKSAIAAEEKKIEKSRDEFTRQTQRHKVILEKMEKRLKLKTHENQEILGKIDSFERSIDKLTIKSLNYQRKKEEIELREKLILDAVLEKAFKLKRIVEKGLPYDLEKREQVIELLVKDIQERLISSHEAVERLWTILKAEEQFGMESDIGTNNIALKSGERRDVRMLRVGHHYLCYYERDRDLCGLLEKHREPETGKTVYSWKESGFTLEERNAIRTAIQVKEGKKPPQWVEVVLPIKVEKEREGADK